MSATYEDFESIQDYLPDQEGDSVTIYRRGGRLHSVPQRGKGDEDEYNDDWDTDFSTFGDEFDFDDGFLDDEFQGRLLVVDEQVKMARGMSIVSPIFFFLFYAILFSFFGLPQWFVSVWIVALTLWLSWRIKERFELSAFKEHGVKVVQEVILETGISEHAILSQLSGDSEFGYIYENLRRYLAQENNLFSEKNKK